MTKKLIILGMDYCGSTAAGRLLRHIRGAANVGEAYWLLHPGIRYTDGHRPFCRDCGFANCSLERYVWARPLHQSLLYDHIIQYFNEHVDGGIDLLVTTDKHISHAERFCPFGDYSALVLWRRPRDHAESWLRRVRGEVACSQADRFGMQTFCDEWNSRYRYMLAQLAENGVSYHVVCWDQIYNDPEGFVDRVSDWQLGSAARWETIPEWAKHDIGGSRTFKPELRSGRPDGGYHASTEFVNELCADVHRQLADESDWIYHA